MPIPAFDHNNVLPPHLGNPAVKTDLSPYLCTILEICNRFSTSPNRIEILKKFVAFRLRINNLGIVDGFQWLDGSFFEDIERSESRPPNDMDVVTFYRGLSSPDPAKIISSFPEFASPVLSKSSYQLDHYAVDYSHSPDTTVEQTRYWIQLFTHKKMTGIWKGILKLPLNTPVDDQQAQNYLTSI